MNQHVLSGGNLDLLFADKGYVAGVINDAISGDVKVILPFDFGFHVAVDLSFHVFLYLVAGSAANDPVARIVAQMYTDYLKRLGAATPFLLTVQVGSLDPVIARNVAQALANELSEAHASTEAAQGGTSLPSGSDLVIPHDRSDLQTAWQTLTTLDLHPWGLSEATEGKERLRYLVDARTGLEL